MKRLRLGYSIASICIISMVTSCTSSNQIGDQIELLPVQLEEDGKWSFVDPNGTIKYEDEFKEAPTCVVNGVFSVKEKDGYVLYKAKDKLTPLKGCEGLKAAGYASDGLIPIVRDKLRIIIVDTDGKEQFKLEPIKGKEVVLCAGGYSDGLLKIEIEGGEKGFVDAKGNVVIKPEYSEASDFSEGRAIVKKDDAYSIIDKKGNTILKLKKDWSPIGNIAYGVVVAKDANDRYLFVNEKGDADKCPAKVKAIFDYNENYYIYSDGDSYGVMSRKDNEVIVRPKYDNIIFGPDDTFVCIDDKGTYILNSKGNTDKSLDEYEGIYTVGKFGISAKDKKTWLLLDSKGDPIKGCEFYGIMPMLFYGANIESDYFSLEGLADSLLDKLSIKGYANIKLGDSPQSLLQSPNKYLYTSDAEIDTLSGSGYKYTYRVNVDFSGIIASNSFDYYSYESTYYWNNVKVSGISISVNAETSLGGGAVKSLVPAVEKKGFKSYVTNYKDDNGIALLTSKESAVLIESVKGSSLLLLHIFVLPSADQLKIIKEEIDKYDGGNVSATVDMPDSYADDTPVIKAKGEFPEIDDVIDVVEEAVMEADW